MTSPGVFDALAEDKVQPGPILLTEEQSALIDIAVRRVRDVTGNPLLDASEALAYISDEYLRDVEELTKLKNALPIVSLPTRRIALVD